MSLHAYIKKLSPDDREAYAIRCGTTVDYLYQIAGGHSKASGTLARKLAQESGFIVSLQKLRPDIFGEPSTPPTPSPAAAHCS